MTDVISQFGKVFFLVLPYDVDDNRHKFGNTADDRQFQHSHGESMLLKHM